MELVSEREENARNKLVVRAWGSGEEAALGRSGAPGSWRHSTHGLRTGRAILSKVQVPAVFFPLY